MMSLRTNDAIDMMEPSVAGRGAVLYAVTLIVAALLILVKFVRKYTWKDVLGKQGALLDHDCEAHVEASEGEAESETSEAVEEQPGVSADADEYEAAVVEEVPVTLPTRFAVYDFDETITRATYPQAYDGTPFGCMSLSIPWDDPRAGNKGRGGLSPTKQFGGLEPARVAALQRHFAAMRDQGWTLCVLSYNLQWDKGEFCLKELLDHYGMLGYFTHQGTPLVYGLRDMRRIGATSKGDFIVRLLRSPRTVTALDLDVAPRGQHLLVDDDDANIAGARACGLLGYQVAKQYEWDGLVGGLGRSDPDDFVKLESIGPALLEPAPERKRRPRARRTKRPADARWRK